MVKVNRLKEEEFVQTLNSKLLESSFSSPENMSDKEYIEYCYKMKGDIKEILSKLYNVNPQVGKEIMRETNADKKKLNSSIESSLVNILGLSLLDINTRLEYIIRCFQHAVNYEGVFEGVLINDDADKFMREYKRNIELLVRKLLEKDKDEFFLMMEPNSKLSEEYINYLLKCFVDEELSTYFYQNSMWINEPKQNLMEKKKRLLSLYKEKYPTATGYCKNMLLSPKNWEKLISDFIRSEQEDINKKLNNPDIVNKVANVEEYLEVMVMFFISYLNRKDIDNRFESFIRETLENEFYKSAKQKESNTGHKENIEIKHNNSSERNQKDVAQTLKDLPSGLVEDLKNLDLTESELLVLDKFLRLELTKFGGEVKTSHILARLKKINKLGIIDDILTILERYTEFSIIYDLIEKKENDGEKTIEPENTLNTKIPKEEKLNNKLLRISNDPSLDNRISGYMNIFKDAGYQFYDEEDFSVQLYNAISKTKGQGLETSIVTTIRYIISGHERLSKKFAHGHYVIRVDKGRRIILNKEKKITHIVSHDEYEKIIDKDKNR